MKIKLQTVLDAMPAATLLANKEMPAKAAYRVSKILRKLNAEARELQEQRNKLIEKYGHKVKKAVDGKERELTEVKPESLTDYTEELKALLAEEVELEGVAPVRFTDLENLGLTPAILIDLEFMIEPPEEAQPKE